MPTAIWVSSTFITIWPGCQQVDPGALTKKQVINRLASEPTGIRVNWPRPTKGRPVEPCGEYRREKCSPGKGNSAERVQLRDSLKALSKYCDFGLWGSAAFEKEALRALPAGTPIRNAGALPNS